MSTCVCVYPCHQKGHFRLLVHNGFHYDLIQTGQLVGGGCLQRMGKQKYSLENKGYFVA